MNIPVPPPFAEVYMPLATKIEPLRQALYKVCPDVSFVVSKESDFELNARIGDDMNITCARHCSEPSHSCILVSIGTTIIPFNDQEKTSDYIQRVVSLIMNKLNWLQLEKLIERLPRVKTIDIVKDGDKVQMMVKASGLDATTTIEKGKVVYCGIPLRTDGMYNFALVSQFRMLIIPEPNETLYVRILDTKNGFVGLHSYQGERKVLSLSNYTRVATKFVVKDIRLFELENFLTNPTSELVVIYTTGTPFTGVVAHLELSTSSFAIIRIGDEQYKIPSDRWAYLKNILDMF